MSREIGKETGRNPTARELAEAKRILALDKGEQRRHPSAVQADQSKLGHINTYGSLPEFYTDNPFLCDSGRRRFGDSLKNDDWVIRRPGFL